MQDIFFKYELPPELIAQHPPQKREQSRLMLVDRKSSRISHHFFSDLPSLLKKDDLLVLNDTQVVKARLYGKRKTTGGKWEGLYLRTLDDGLWEMMSHTRGWPLPGETIVVEPGPLELLLVRKNAGGIWHAKPSLDGDAPAILEAHGKVPLPPYIRKGKALEEDTTRYQTIFARHPGAVAAPTAGLHFTEELFVALKAMGVDRSFVTLHVGPGTFKPLPESLPEVYNVDPEFGILPGETLTAIRECKQNQGRLVSVGTTSTRLLETAARANLNQPWQGWADLTIRPPFKFEQVEILITNFHLPRSTLLLLVGAFAGDNLIRLAYDEAIKNQYRFFSYGDAML
ncbi:tRNA preQ1(34) S-adenosylmethionine ribosyltransferase-isomerase QueA, partial [bacterium]|nr:tRNA preQ1(34) S-adenosylmethionine ribosyltransferase-isomerase QueA [bacterium]